MMKFENKLEIGVYVSGL